MSSQVGEVFPDVLILLTTYFPEGEAGQQRKMAVVWTLQSWQTHLKYPKEMLRLHIADDGSKHELTELFDWWYATPSTSFGERQGVGASLNVGFEMAQKKDIPLVLYAVDDWALRRDFYLGPWAKLLMEDESLGAVRLGPPHPGLTGEVIRAPSIDDWEEWYLLLGRHHYAFSHRPTLFHLRFWEHYGPFLENCSALESERIYNERFCSMEGPEIALALPHPWEHISKESLSSLVPG